MSSLLPGGLFALALGLGGVVVYQAVAPVAPVEEPAAPATTPRLTPPPALPVYTPPPEETFAAINARAIFDPARRQVAEPLQTGSSSATPPPLSLVGVAIGASGSIALLKKPDAPLAISARLGQTIGGWQLVRIEPDFVVFRAGATDYTVRLRAAAGLPQPPLNNASPPVVTGQPGR